MSNDEGSCNVKSSSTCFASKSLRNAKSSVAQHATAVWNVRNEGSDAILLLVATLCNIGEDVAAEDECRAGRGSVTRRPDSKLGM
jgi:hypothetical protein